MRTERWPVLQGVSQQTNEYETTYPQRMRPILLWEWDDFHLQRTPFMRMTPAPIAHDVRVGDSDQSSTLSFGLQAIVPGACHRRGTFLLSLHLLFERQPSPGSPGAQPHFSADEKREHERSRGTASPVFGACGGHASDTDQSSIVWVGVP